MMMSRGFLFWEVADSSLDDGRFLLFSYRYFLGRQGGLSKQNLRKGVSLIAQAIA